MQTQSDADGPWTGGWMIAVLAGLGAAILARVLGDVGMGTAMIIGGVVFLVFGVLLGSGGVELTVLADDHGSDHGGDNGHKGHGLHIPVHATLPSSVTMLEPAVALPPEPVEAGPSVADLAVPPPQPPQRLDAPRGGVADDLTVIEGIGPVMEKLCHEMGFYHFDQIAAWSPAELDWVDRNLKDFKGRATRDRWVAQARLIGAVGVDEFRRRAKTNDY